MPGGRISAEVTPTAGKANEAARALQQLGFKVKHIGKTISVEGAESLWGRTFGVTFEERQTKGRDDPERSGSTYRWPSGGDVTPPATLGHLISAVDFVVPPEFF